MVLLIANTTWEKYFLQMTKTVENKLLLRNTLYPKLVNVYKTLGVIQCIPGDTKLPLRKTTIKASTLSSQFGKHSKCEANLQLLNKVAGPQWAVDHNCGATHLMTKAAGALWTMSTNHVAELLTCNTTIKLPLWFILTNLFHWAGWSIPMQKCGTRLMSLAVNCGVTGNLLCLCCIFI